MSLDDLGVLRDLHAIATTWTCHVCGEERLDDKISVFKRDDSEALGRPAGSVVQNLRYCNDRASCTARVADVRKPDVRDGDRAHAQEIKRT
jgi:hypothetical protein